MLITGITQLGITRSMLLAPALLSRYTNIYPTVYLSKGKGPVCPGSAGGKGSAAGGGAKKSDLKRLQAPGKCRLCFVPEEWFLFFHSKTGVSGPYIFGIVLTNYLLSKEIFIMEHEYYLGISISLVLYLVVTRAGAGIGASLDKEIDAIANEFEQTRKDEVAFYDNMIKRSKDSQWRAEGQKELMNAKKENIGMQLEAEYRERMMTVYQTVKGRMDYHVKKNRAEARIQQKWMTGWILENVNKSITPDFLQQALSSAIRDLEAAASQSK